MGEVILVMCLTLRVSQPARSRSVFRPSARITLASAAAAAIITFSQSIRYISSYPAGGWGRYPPSFEVSTTYTGWLMSEN
ncbi:hypothetical protein ASPBRDRAFT_38625 [Aspergillus brasiliensis CBS 101740]|uniref:Uncharacterized protein n=1 Tax=Aspergillus brasiliensis (strain CBS 101740 / IMI 381727 / IBT 21946) TaxID=767769 RepID=A0A1L9UWY0_ASPBC|nr:hypothetical protein ASPBRDRAFT_38625 [Aspergillus brasiliensis CBS 101740]